LALLLRWPSLKIQGQYLCSRSALVDEFHKCSFSLLFCYIRTLLSTSFDSTARVTSTAPPKSIGMSDADLQFSTCCVLTIFLEYPKKDCLFSDRYEPVDHGTSNYSRNIGILLYAAQRRSLSNVATMKFFVPSLLISHCLPLGSSDLLLEINDVFVSELEQFLYLCKK
jgi:hypothetical protein